MKSLAEDTVHDTFIKLAKSISHWKSFSESQQKAYIFVSIKYQCITVYNKLKTEKNGYTFQDDSFYYRDFIEDYCDKQHFLDFQKSVFSTLPWTALRVSSEYLSIHLTIKIKILLKF